MRLPLLVAILMVPASTDAGPISIQILSANYTTSVRTTTPDGLTTSRISTSQRDSLFDRLETDPGQIAEAVASPLTTRSVASTSGSCQRGPGACWTPYYSGFAGAETVIDFIVAADGLAALTVDANYGIPSYSELVIELLNLTTGMLLVDTGWSWGNGDEWRSFQNQFREFYTPDPDPTIPVLLTTSDHYRLTLSSSARSQGDGTTAGVTIGGLIVPEPALISLLAIGLCAAALMKPRMTD